MEKKNFSGNQNLSDEDLEKQFNRIKKSHHSLQEEFDKFCKESSFTKETIKFIENPRNFTASQWEETQNELKKHADKVEQILGEDLVRLIEKESKKSLTKERKRKWIGSRKKWIQIR